MNAILTSWPYNVSGRYELGYGYGTSSHVMLPGFTSEGVATDAADCGAEEVVSASSA